MGILSFSCCVSTVCTWILRKKTSQIVRTSYLLRLQFHIPTHPGEGCSPWREKKRDGSGKRNPFSLSTINFILKISCCQKDGKHSRGKLEERGTDECITQCRIHQTKWRPCLCWVVQCLNFFSTCSKQIFPWITTMATWSTHPIYSQGRIFP